MRGPRVLEHPFTGRPIPPGEGEQKICPPLPDGPINQDTLHTISKVPCRRVRQRRPAALSLLRE